ncbi:Hpt domain-containing protein [Vibrio panuliri]|uniref:HPt domain-containing protein n=1 Tax=Vibrio panuliri TaxID=1381081 RepID=A0A1Q9HJY7_9VIBR|nr:Hpt domain-containing protein [Vibrio panuliri]KAB1453834.1 Hpt domain-containing protein [Vibrio panuliri]OLQ90616.1 hypothetical protein BIY22_06390 [Vibrio panuliri]OLQ92004.1 hypothetical protein BIY20_09210 [Vibrio panuliri]
MDKRQLTIGWSLVLLWFVTIAAITYNFQATEQRVEQIEQLGGHIQEFRNSLYFDKPYRSDMTAQQKQRLTQITELCEQLKKTPHLAWSQPDIEQLLFSTQRFVELSQAYIDTELALKELIASIQQRRLQFNTDPDIQAFYYKLSAYVFEALFSAQSSNSMAYRDLDTLYSQSLTLQSDQRQLLQTALAQTSSVMGSFAQGGYLVEQLANHSVHQEVRDIETRYHHSMTMAVVVGVVVSGALILFLMTLYHRRLVTKTTSDSEQTNESSSQSYRHEVVAPSMASPTPEPVEPTTSDEVQIDFAVMLDSLGDDKEAMCMLLEVFINDHQDDVAQISSSLQSAPDEAKRKAHSLKGVGGNLGAYQLRDIAGQIEVAIEQDVTQVPQLLPQLDSKLKLAIKEAQDFIQRENG